MNSYTDTILEEKQITLRKADIDSYLNDLSPIDWRELGYIVLTTEAYKDLTRKDEEKPKEPFCFRLYAFFVFVLCLIIQLSFIGLNGFLHIMLPEITWSTLLIASIIIDIIQFFALLDGSEYVTFSSKGIGFE